MTEVTTVHVLVGISRLAEMTGSTARALRHYEDAGLVRPHRTAAGVRQFTPAQCDLVAMIVRLRRCDLPLDVIRSLLTETCSDAERQTRLQAVLNERAQDLERKLKLVTATLKEAA
ncbi:MAG: MerR family transcriptional regulator [Alphaproteobacteria bacterium]|nr:MAG: MerR family transcriptional regulator [Alphaproteobacteria bacterium]